MNNDNYNRNNDNYNMNNDNYNIDNDNYNINDDSLVIIIKCFKNYCKMHKKLL